MTTNEETKEKIRVFFGNYIKKNDIQDDEDIFATKLITSLFAMQLVLFVEKEFKIKVENQDLDLKNFNSVNAITGFIERKAAAS